MTPTARTMEWLRGKGHIVGKVERYNHYSRTTNDLFGFVDLISVGTEIVAVQCTSSSNHAARVAKIEGTPEAALWLNAGGLVWVVSWRKLVRKNKDGSKSKVPRWAGKRTEFKMSGWDVTPTVFRTEEIE
jgi:hypothetical protein